jgi:hypothetical protein
MGKQTEIMNLIVAFRNFAKAPENRLIGLRLLYKILIADRYHNKRTLFYLTTLASPFLSACLSYKPSMCNEHHVS